MTNNAADTTPTQTVNISRIADDAGLTQGDVPNGGATDDTAPQVFGTISAPLKAGEVVALYRDGVKVGEATMTGSTAWRFNDSGLAHGGNYNYTAKVEKGGKTGPASAAYGIKVDTQVDVTPPPSNNFSLLEGTQDVFDFNPAEKVTFSLSSTDDSAFEIVNGKLRFRAPPAFLTPIDDNGDNVYFVKVKARDAVGNEVTYSLRVDITQDPNAPKPPDTIP